VKDIAAALMAALIGIAVVYAYVSSPAFERIVYTNIARIEA
jgi:hypothetical protein